MVVDHSFCTCSSNFKFKHQVSPEAQDAIALAVGSLSRKFSPRLAMAGAEAPARRLPQAQPTLRQSKKFCESIARKDYVGVMKAVHQGYPPNMDWKGLLPMRVAVLTGDADMVALLHTMGADANRIPKALVRSADNQSNKEVVLGKSARGVAEEMAKDMANPLHGEARGILLVIDDATEARKRVRLLHAKLEEQMSKDSRESGYIAVICLIVMLTCFASLRYLGATDDHGDTHEL